MSTVLYKRPTRRPAPPPPTGEMPLQEPPTLPEAASGNLSMILTYLPMALGSVAMAMVFAVPGGGRGGLSLLTGGLMAVASVSMLFGQVGRGSGDRKQQLNAERRDYLRYLQQMRRQVRRHIEQQRKSAAWTHPSPESLWSVALSSRLWERRTTDDDFADVRVATGEQRLAIELKPPETKPVEDLEPLCAGALRRFLRAYSAVPDMPIGLYLRGFAQVRFEGDRAQARGLVRAVLAQLATFHAPEELRVAVCAPGDRRSDWEWVKWLPHALHATERDAAGPVRLIGDDYTELEGLLGEEFTGRPRFDPAAVPSAQEPFVVLVLDGAEISQHAQVAAQGFRNAVVIDLGETLPRIESRFVLALRVAEGLVETVSVDRAGKETTARVGRPDQLSIIGCGALARFMSSYRTGGKSDTGEPLAVDLELTSLLGVGAPQSLEPQQTWAVRPSWDQLRIPIGIAADGSPVELDIKEAARGGMGPHGMLIGATGSGKSELLRTLVLGLAITHSSEILNFVLVDFKGGATFLGLDSLPHTSAVITNLADELPLVDRMYDSLHGELVRRQELLRSAGNYSSVHDYEKARAAGTPLAPIPSLFVVVDEFSELLSAKREFMDLFVMIGRLGRSLGVHLLLASQRLDEGRINQLESHLSYRVGLRTFSAMESRAVLGVADAYELPSSPGNGYLKTDTSTLVRFKAAYVSGSVGSAGPARRRQALIEQQVVPYVSSYVEPNVRVEEPDLPEVDDASTEDVETLLDVVVERLHGQGPPAHQVWLPPLGDAPGLEDILGPIGAVEGGGLQAVDWPGNGALKVSVGVVDQPFQQKRGQLLADLSAGAGHAAIVGAPQSGKSTMLRTLLLSLALTHTPRQVQFYCLDFGGGSLGTLADLPHVGSVANRLDVERANRTIMELSNLLNQREETFQAEGIDSMAAYRRARNEGRFADDPYGDVFLVVDGWFTMRQDFEALEPTLQELASRGLGFGIHLIVAATRWSEIRPWLRDLLGTRLELRLGDAIESEVDSRAAANVPTIPGRGLTAEKLQFLSALPRLGTGESTDDLAEDVRSLVQQVRAAWTGPAAPRVRLLPRRLDLAELPEPKDQLRVPFAWDENNLEPVWHDFTQHPHLMVFGDTETGKTNLLRLMARAVASRYSVNEARVIFADTRRELYDAVPPEMQLSYSVSGSALLSDMGEAATSMTKRVPGPDITPSRLRLRDWWTGPELFVIVDDYDLLASGYDSPLKPLVDLLPQGYEIGLHLIVARSAAGAGRAMMDPVLRRLWDLGTPGVLFSCGRDEGAFLGDTKPRSLPVGRAQLVSRRYGTSLIQTAMMAQPEPAVPA